MGTFLEKKWGILTPSQKYGFFQTALHSANAKNIYEKITRISEIKNQKSTIFRNEPMKLGLLIKKKFGTEIWNNIDKVFF